MTNNYPIEVQQVGNGFIVRPTSDRNGFVATDSIYVFQTYSELVIWLGQHFDHRSESVVADKAAQAKRK